MLVGAGLYYNFSHTEEDIWFTDDSKSLLEVTDNNNNKFPLQNIHQFSSNIVGERVFSPSLTLRAGFDFVCGWEREDYKRTDSSNTDDGFMDGYHWGIGASAGGTVRLQQCTFEPFVNGGFQSLDVNGDGDRTSSAFNQFELDKDRTEWYVSGGFSVSIGK